MLHNNFQHICCIYSGLFFFSLKVLRSSVSDFWSAWCPSCLHSFIAHDVMWGFINLWLSSVGRSHGCALSLAQHKPVGRYCIWLLQLRIFTLYSDEVLSFENSCFNMFVNKLLLTVCWIVTLILSLVNLTFPHFKCSTILSKHPNWICYLLAS